MVFLAASALKQNSLYRAIYSTVLWRGISFTVQTFNQQIPCEGRPILEVHNQYKRDTPLESEVSSRNSLYSLHNALIAYNGFKTLHSIGAHPLTVCTILFADITKHESAQSPGLSWPRGKNLHPIGRIADCQTLQQFHCLIAIKDSS